MALDIDASNLDHLVQCFLVKFISNFSTTCLQDQMPFPGLLLVVICVVATAVASSASATSTLSARLFHPSFPLKFKSVLSQQEFENLQEVKKKTNNKTSLPSEDKLKRLPWKTLPDIGISASLDKDIYSAKEIDDCYETEKSNGHIVWAKKLKNPRKGCLLLNHWSQHVVLLTDYDREQGAKGYEVVLGQTPEETRYLIWPPFTLETEVAKSQWQPIEVSDNILSGEIFRYFPSQMKTAPWEFLFLLLLSDEEGKDSELYQTLFDTGLSPKQGLIAYMRLLGLMTQRAELWQDVPSYRKVFETEIPN